MARALNDNEQGIVMFLVFVLPAFMVWCGNGFPIERAELGFLVASVISGVLAYLKEILGWKPSENTPDEPVSPT